MCREPCTIQQCCVTAIWPRLISGTPVGRDGWRIGEDGSTQPVVFQRAPLTTGFSTGYPLCQCFVFFCFRHLIHLVMYCKLPCLQAIYLFVVLDSAQPHLSNNLCPHLFLYASIHNAWQSCYSQVNECIQHRYTVCIYSFFTFPLILGMWVSLMFLQAIMFHKANCSTNWPMTVGYVHWKTEALIGATWYRYPIELSWACYPYSHALQFEIVLYHKTVISVVILEWSKLLLITLPFIFRLCIC